MKPEQEMALVQAESAAKDAKIAALEAELAAALALIEQLTSRLKAVEGQQAKDSHNSSKPPSSDGLSHKTRSQRQKSAKKSGGQAGHVGRTLKLVEQPDTVVMHRPVQCAHCQHALGGIAGEVVERRQVHDLPPLRLVVNEHQMAQVRCPQCQQLTRASFPADVVATTQYGAGVRALAVYLQQYQLVPGERTCEALADLCGCEVSEGTLARWVEQAAQTLAPSIEQIAEYVRRGRLQHADETGVRLHGKLHWVHVNSTRWLTHLAWHAKRGYDALEAIGIWPHFAGRTMRDRWASYDRYSCAMSLCVAHLLRDLTYLEEHEQQEWAKEMKDVLLGMHLAAAHWRDQGASSLPALERDEWVAQYFAVLVQGFAAQPSALPQEVPRQRGRRKQTPAKNLLDDLLRRAEQVLAFLDDLSLPFTNNQAERDLRMVKVQQKISGTFRSEAGISAFCRIRSYLSTMRKQGRPMLAALSAVFAGHPLPIAWGAE
jgi:transposase